MGSIVSTLQGTLFTVSAAIKALSTLNTQFSELLKRVALPPGYPVDEPTSSYWLDNPPFPDLCDIRGTLEAETDVVIIGSGITSASIAKSLLELSEKDDAPLRVTVFEARELSSGATGRNGGHIKSTPYEMFCFYKKRVGPERARDFIRFQMRHLPMLIEVGEKFPVGEAREVQTVDLFLEEEDFINAKTQVDEAKQWLPEIEHTIWEAERARKEFGANDTVVGALSYRAGAVWPYRLVTSVWNHLLQRYPNLTIRTHTTVTDIAHKPGRSPYEYNVQTSSGEIKARHVIHATNGFAPQLLPFLRGHLTGALAHMSAQRPGNEFPVSHGDRSWSIVYAPGYDYVTQRPDNEDGSQGDLMVGGLDQLGRWDDSRVNSLPGIHIRGVMPMVFEPNWGEGGLVRKAWTGILGMTGDFLPFVGRLPGCPEPQAGKGSTGHWMAAGFNGEGMVSAWLSGTALAITVLGREDEELEKGVGRPGGKLRDWFPQDELKIDAERLKRARLENLADAV
ncbi:FAD dependent oxidoreductase-domain-containing protein [Thelonectria olida]|uniref:FAD dependent oxidoreductase-domain-containing protein n=1 Tax=Thelonectria olida TaxID=1576542 RepID=A0A9P8WDL5_9HYPO|nr:FAD dependent oxidoreductase-domain-containing protein [Thelonectria olida]